MKQPIIQTRALSVLPSAYDRQDSWMSPGTAPTPTVDAGVRAWDYLSQINQQWSKRKTELTSFGQLRAIAEWSPLARLIIEKVKERLIERPWQFRLKPMPGESKGDTIKRTATDKGVEKLTAQFQYPDGEHCWQDWARMLLEEMIVIDAASVYFDRTVPGSPRMVVFDGSTIDRKIDTMGMTPRFDAPAPDNVAYQQIIKGTIIANLTTRDLLYLPRNPRVQKLYGYSCVEQMMQIAITSALRWAWQRNYYDASDIPLGTVELPADSSKESIERWVTNLASVLSGNVEDRTKLLPIPAGGKITLLKQSELTDGMDEYLARCLCYALGETPTGFVRMMNRASGQQQDDTREEAGEIPTAGWLKRLVDRLVQSPLYLNCPNVEFTYVEQAEVDSLKQAQVDFINVPLGITTVNEARVRDGKEPLTPEELEALKPAPPPQFQQGDEGDDNGDAPPKGSKKPGSTKQGGKPGEPGNEAGKTAASKKKRSILTSTSGVRMRVRPSAGWNRY